jgi:hypothetical protein
LVELAALGFGEAGQEGVQGLGEVAEGGVDHCEALLGQGHLETAPVLGGEGAFDEARRFEVVEALGHARARAHQLRGEVRGSAGVGRADAAQAREDVELPLLDAVAGDRALAGGVDHVLRHQDQAHEHRRCLGLQFRALALPVGDQAVDGVLGRVLGHASHSIHKNIVRWRTIKEQTISQRIIWRRSCAPSSRTSASSTGSG